MNLDCTRKLTPTAVNRLLQTFAACVPEWSLSPVSLNLAVRSMHDALLEESRYLGIPSCHFSVKKFDETISRIFRFVQ